MKTNRLQKQQRAAGKTAAAVKVTIERPSLFAVAEANQPLSIRVQDVTPKMAAKWLESNADPQRKVNWRIVEAIANDIRAGQWKLTHQGILFNSEGVLLDGQHRLNAIVQSGITCQMMVTHSDVAQFHDPIDRIRPRSVAMLLGVNPRDTACYNMLRMLETGIEVNTPMTVADAEGVFERHNEELQFLHSIPGWATLRGPMAAACVWAIPCGREKVYNFARQVVTGEMIGRGDPAYAFRSWTARSKGIRAWQATLASLNCLRHALAEVKLSSVYTGESGYRAFVSKRRALHVPNTPPADLVTGVAWTPTARDRQ